MKTYLHPFVTILLACCLPLQSVPGFSQAENTPTSTRVINKNTVITQFQKLQQQSKSMQVLDSRLRSLHFAPANGAAHYWGQTGTYQKVVAGRAENLVGTVYIRDYVNPNSKDGAALGQVIITTSPGETQAYSFYLIAPNGDPTKTQEYAVQNNEATLQHSWWSCVKGQLPTFGSQCATAVVTCAGPSLIAGTFSWAAYAACVSVACSIGFLKASLCCACNGGTLCSILVGKCSQGSPAPEPVINSGYNPPPPLCPKNEKCCETKNGKCLKCIGAKMECP